VSTFPYGQIPGSGRWAVDYAEMLLAVEQARAGIGGLLEHWPTSPAVTEARLREVWAILEAASKKADYDRLVRRLRRWDERAKNPPKTYDQEYAAAVRAWGLANGYRPKPTGKLSIELMDAYDEAMRA
jgi:hypothetical protein